MEGKVWRERKVGPGRKNNWPPINVVVGKELYQGRLQLPWDSSGILPLILLNKKAPHSKVKQLWFP